MCHTQPIIIANPGTLRGDILITSPIKYPIVNRRRPIICHCSTWLIISWFLKYKTNPKNTTSCYKECWIILLQVSIIRLVFYGKELLVNSLVKAVINTILNKKGL